jgi:chromosome segregation ATPase
LEDKHLTCRQCGREFVFTKGEQDFYQQKDLNLPGRCPECRSAKRIQRERLICSQCKTELAKEASIYCTACLASVHLESELEIKQGQKVTDEAQSKLQNSEAREAELAQSLSQKEHLVAELEKKVRSIGQELETMNQELERVHQFHSDLQWIHPSLDGIQAQLEALEHGQNKINQRMLQLVEKIHEVNQNTGILEIIKRSFRRYGNQRV